MKPTRSRLGRIARTALPAAPLALAALPSAHAVIIYTDIADITMTYGQGKFIFVDMGTGGATGEAVLANPTWQAPYVIPLASASFYMFFRYNADWPEWSANNTTIFDGNNLVAGIYRGGQVSNLPLGTTIDGAITNLGNYAKINRQGANDAQWAPGTTSYIGVKFDMSTSPLYGWVRLTYALDKTLTVHDFAYESSGGSILAGAIPEPSTYALMVAGLLAGSATLYRRRQQKQAAA